MHTPHELPIVLKACPCLLRRRGGRLQTLAFVHPCGDRQIVKGTVEEGLVFSFFWQDLPGDYRGYHPVFRQVLQLLERSSCRDVHDEGGDEPEPDCVVVIPVLDDGRVVLIREARRRWRGADAERGWGCPAGHVERGESVEATAVRETAEEAGIVLVDVQVLGRPFYPSGKDGRLHHVVTGHATRAGGGGGDQYEEILDVQAFSIDDVRDLIRRGDVLHGPSLVALVTFIGSAERARSDTV